MDRFLGQIGQESSGYMVEYAGGKPSSGGKEQAQRPLDAANGQGVPQVAPPMIPATIEQQRNHRDAAMQYGGSRPYDTSGQSSFAMIALGVGGLLLWMRMRE